MSEISHEALDWLESVIDRKIQNALSKGTKIQYRGRVLSKDKEGIVWVEVPGVADKLPADISLVEVGNDDMVQVTIGDGMAVIDGNQSAPSVNRTTVESIASGVVAPVEIELKNIVAEQGSFQLLQAEYAEIVNATIEDLKASKADIDFANITWADIDQAFINALTANYAHITDGVIDNATIGYANVDGLSANYATISSLNSATARIGDLEADHVSVSDFEAEQANIDNLQAATADIGTIRANSAKVQNLTAEQLSAATGYVGSLTAGNVSAADIIADHATVSDLDATYATIDVLESDYITASAIESNYTKTDFSNTTVSWIQNGTIKNAAITNEMVQDISANKLTAGTINGSVINVTNLNADNITTGTINGQRIGEGSLSLDKLSEDVYTEAEVDSIVDGLNDRIDGAIESHTGNAVPTLQNSPASSWNTAALKDEHVGDVYYVVNSNIPQNGYCYRFTKSGTGASATYSWQLIKDSDVTAALSRLQTAEGKIGDIEAFDVTMSTFKTNTEGAISTLQTKTSNLETSLGDKVSTSTFNELSQTVDGNSSTITTLGTVLTNNGLTTSTNISNTVNSVQQTANANSASITSLTTTTQQLSSDFDDLESSVTTLSTTTTNKFNTVDQTLDGIETSIGSIEDTLETKADGSTVSSLSSQVNTISDTVAGHTQSISSINSTLSTKADGSTVSTLSTRVNDISDTVDGHTSSLSSITTEQTSIKQNAVKSTVQLWFTKANTTAPSKPTAHVTTNSSSTANAWNLAVPTYNASYPNYFYCYEYEYLNGTYGWSGVTRDIATGEAQSTARTAASDASTAKSDASSAVSTANTANTNASNAVSTANTASANASNAVSTANTAAADASTAKADAASAVSTANTASTNASAAVSTANTAKATADKNVKETVLLWYSKADATAPSKPTSAVTSTSTSGNAWRVVVPTYSASYPYYFYCYQYKLADGTYAWSSVVYDQATTEAQSTARAASSSLATYITSNDAAIQSLQNQVDGQIEAWYYSVDPTTSNVPASDWTTDALKARHEGDLYYNVTSGHSWRWLKNGSTYSWQQIPDSDAAAALAAAQNAQNTANNKRRIFTATPTVPYDKGDLWVNGSVVKYATTARSSGNYTASDWSTTATDDTAANAAQATANKNVRTSQQLWFTKANSTAPGKPTSKVEAVTTTGNAWTTRVPTYDASYPHYFYCMQYIAADGTVSWSDVVYDQATTEAQSVARTASASLTSLQSDYATYKQTTTQNIASLTSNTYTKTEVNGLISEEESNRNSAIEQSAAAINLNVSQNYTTKTEFENLEIGGRNLLKNSGQLVDSWTKNQATVANGVATISPTANGDMRIYQMPANGYWTWLANTSYVASVEARSDNGALLDINAVGASKRQHGDTVGTSWKRYSFAFTTSSSVTSGSMTFGMDSSSWSGKTLQLRQPKLEYGNKATDWTPAPEDIETRVTAAEAAITVNADNISSKVSQTDYNGETVASLINQSADSVKIQANHVNIQGVITAINNDTTTTIDGGKITANSISIGSLSGEIGGRNLLRNTREMAYGTTDWAIGRWRAAGNADMSKSRVVITDGPFGTCGALQIVGTQSTTTDTSCFGMDSFRPPGGYVVGELYTFSMYARATSGTGMAGFQVSKDGYAYGRTYVNGNDETGWATYQGVTLSTSWKRIWITYRVSATNGNLYIGGAGTNATIQMCCCKVEKGERVTDWTPAPEDVDAGIADAAKTATSYITDIDGGGVSVHTPDDTDLSKFAMNADSLSAYDEDGDKYFEVSADGLRYGANTAATTDDVGTVDGRVSNLDDYVRGREYILTEDSLAQEGVTYYERSEARTYFEIDLEVGDPVDGYYVASGGSYVPASGYAQAGVTYYSDRVEYEYSEAQVTAGVTNVTGLYVADGSASLTGRIAATDVAVSELGIVASGIQSRVEAIVGGLSQSSRFIQSADGFTFSLDEVIDRIDGNLETLGNYVNITTDEVTGKTTMTLGGKGHPVCAQLSETGLSFYPVNQVDGEDQIDTSNPIASLVVTGTPPQGVLVIHRAVVVNELRLGDWTWMPRDNGNLSLKWIGA